MSAAYALALHTSSPDLGLALQCLRPSDLGSTVRSQVWPLGRDLSSQLHQHLQDFIQPQTWQDLAWIAVAIGPGSFTGTRIGVVTARTLAQQLEIPLFGISSFAAIAQAQSDVPHPYVAIEMPAQRREVFGSVYQRQDDLHPWMPMLSDRIFTPEAWDAYQATLTEPYTLIQAPAAQGQYVEQVLELAIAAWKLEQQPHWSSVLPYYGQHPVTLTKHH